MALPKPQLNGDVLAYDEIQTDVLNDLETTVTDHNSKIMQLLNWMGLVKDYVVESGSNADGSWEKWNSGKLVQWGIGTTSHPAINVYYFKEHTLPIPFVNGSYTLICVGEIYESQGDLSVNSKTSSKFNIASKRKDNTYDTRYGFSAIGRWE